MNRRHVTFIFASLLLRTATVRADETNTSVALAADLAAAGHYDAAAVEYRRLAMESAAPDDQAGYYWAAAYTYASTNEIDRAQGMLDRAEKASPSISRPALTLRAQLAQEQGETAAARFYFESVLQDSNADDSLKIYCNRHLSGLAMQAGELETARQHLADLPEGSARSNATQAVEIYSAGHDKRPWLGGTLGLVPGLGHAYAGKYANGLRCLMLNGIFMYGMSDTAGHGNWGAFSVITFFELTWYSGSIYGGRDAVEDYNRDRLDHTITDIQGTVSPKPDLLRLPIIHFSF